jgi:outer membrane receptor protein involved in Fe transport
MSFLRRAVSLALYGSALAVVPVPSALAQIAQPQTARTDKDAANVMESISVIGTRRANASATDTPVPVDIIPMAKVAEQGGQFDLTQTLQYISPSFNSTRQTGADNADLIDSAALRGLGSDQTLVLVNGKRRHTTALVNLFGARNRGNTGTDLNAIPLLAIEAVQVLRDGAAAQYGSDAIAGVIDIVLKKRPGCEAVAGYGQYSAGDGKNYLATAYCGLQVGEKGVIAVTAEFLDRGRSNRAEADNPRTIGDTKVRNETIYVNGELPTSDTAAVYFTLGGQKRDASSAAFARGGIGSDDIPSRNSAAMYPNGFVPFINGDIDDRYAILGYRSRVGEWNADLSQTYGYNRLRNNISNTLNASIANLDLTAGGPGTSPSRFDAGGFSFGQLTTNLDFSRFFPGLLSGVNVAFGAEYRRENYRIRDSRVSSPETRPTRAATAAPPMSTWRPTSPIASRCRRPCATRTTAISARPRPARSPAVSASIRSYCCAARRARGSAPPRCSRSTSPRRSPISSAASPWTWCSRPTAGPSPMPQEFRSSSRRNRRAPRSASRGRRPARSRSRLTCTTSRSTTASCCRAVSMRKTIRRWAASSRRWAWARRSSL